jgi:cell division protein FtsB
MKKVKIGLWVLIFGLMGLLFYQNKVFFWDMKQSLRLNLGVLPEFNSATLPVVFFFLLFFVFGLVVAYLFTLPEKVRSRKTIKKLSASSSAHELEIAQLKSGRMGAAAQPAPSGPPESSVTSPLKPR